MADPFARLAATDAHPLVASSVFHYEFEFIHPFVDGNGRMERLWQNLIPARWHPMFGDLPVESLVHAHQAEYYLALEDGDQRGASAPFSTFMLRMIDDAVRAATPQVTPRVAALLAAIHGAMGRLHLQAALGRSDWAPLVLARRPLRRAVRCGGRGTRRARRGHADSAVNDAPLPDRWRRPRRLERREAVELPHRELGAGRRGGRPGPSNARVIESWAKTYHDALHPHSAGGAYVNMMMDEGQERVRE